MRKISSIFKSKFYMKSLILVIIASIIPFIFFSLGSYYIGISQIRKQLDLSQNMQTQQMEQRINEQLEIMEQIMVKWSFNHIFQKIIDSDDIFKDFTKTSELYNVLNIMRNSHSMIGKVFFYINKDAIIFDDQKGLIYINEKQKDRLALLTSGTKDFSYIDAKKIDGLTDDNIWNTYLVIKIDNTSNRNDGFLIIGFNKTFVERLFTQLNPDNLNFTFVIQKNQDIYIPASNKISLATDILEKIKNEVLQKQDVSGKFVMNAYNENYSTSYRTYSKSGWKYIMVVPLSRLYSPVRDTTRILTLMGIISFILIGGISLLFSNKIYLPIKQLTEFFRLGNQRAPNEPEEAKDEIAYIQSNIKMIDEERKLLLENYKKNKEIIRESFLLQLLQKHLYNYSEEELKETMERMGWKCYGQSFAVIYLKFFISNDHFNESSYLDGQLTTIAAVNSIKKLMTNMEGVLGVLNLHNLSAALLIEINNNNDEKAVRIYINSICVTILKNISGYFGCKMVIGVGKPTKSLRNLSMSFDDAIQAIRYREVDNEGEIIFYEELVIEPKKSFNYPMELGFEIVQDITSGLVDEAMEKIKICTNELKEEWGKELYIQQGMLHLLGSVIHAMINSRIDVNRVYSGQNLYEQLCGITEVDEMIGWFNKKVLMPFITEIVETQEIKYRQMIFRVKQYIEKNYMKDISLDLCAEIVGFPPKRLSQVFHKVTGQHFVNYVVNYRMEKAKVLLRETDQDVNDIAALVGYQPSYFIRTFKKSFDITPGEYRNTMR